MHNVVRPIASGLVSLAILGAPALAQATPLDGVWRNPKNTVHVDIRPCGDGVCGTVVWANPEAKAASRKASGKELVGLQVFRDLKQNDRGQWKGKVFAPDYNATFAGTAVSIDATSLRATGCVLAFICKSQVWKKIDAKT
jgi:uncharacterized protein (DUF2147 family)